MLHPLLTASDLGSILVKHVSKLQHEIQAWKARRKFLDVLEPCVSFKRQYKEMLNDTLAQLLVKHVSKLEKEKIVGAQETSERTSSMKNNTKSLTVANEHDEERYRKGRNRMGIRHRKKNSS